MSLWELWMATQFSAGYNYAHTVRHGHQIGFVNYADSTAKVPFGLFSWVH